MYKAIIDRGFFELNSSRSAGLITGLKKLSRKGFVIEVQPEGFTPDDTLKKILAAEKIEIGRKKKTDNPGVRLFYITMDASGDRSSVNGKREEITVYDGSDTEDFGKAVNKVLSSLRTSSQHRKTKETDIRVSVALDGEGQSEIKTGIGFFDHMLEQIAKHANLNLQVKVNGDLEVDEHHTVEDTGITLGMALNDALGDKLGIKRYGFYLPMDEAIARCALDLGGRSHLNFKCKFKREMVGEFPTELVNEFFRGLASGLKANIFLRAKGKNDHHKIEAMFKVFAKALNEACRLDERAEEKLPTTKGVL